MASKAKQQANHARLRAWQRYGIRFTHQTAADLTAQIRSGKARFLERQSNRVTKFEVEVNGAWIPVIYDATRKQVVTFLPKEGEPICE